MSKSLTEGKRTITDKFDLIWDFDGAGFILSMEQEERIHKTERFKADEWDVEIVLTPKFKPGYYRFIGETNPPTPEEDVSTRDLVYYDTPPWNVSWQDKDPNNYKRYSLVEE